MSDRYLNGIPADSRIRTDGRFLKETDIRAEKEEKLHCLDKLTKERGQTLAQMAVSWILRDGIVTSVIVGSSKVQQILDNAKAIENTTFPQAELKLIDEFSF